MSKERRDFIHRDAKLSENMNLPFDIRKPKKEPQRNITFTCPECGNVMFIGKFTYLIECSSCKNLVKPGG